MEIFRFRREQAVLFGQQIVSTTDLCRRRRQRAVSERIDQPNHTNTFVAYGQYVGIEKVSEDMDGGSKVITLVFKNLQSITHSIDAERSILGRKKSC